MSLFGRETPESEAKARAWGDWLRQHPYAIAATVLGAFSLTHLGTLVVDSVAAIVLGILAHKRIKLGDRHGRGLAWAGIACGMLSLLIAIWLYFIAPRLTGVAR